MNYLGLTVAIVSGVMMLKGRNWARLLYVLWGAGGSVVGLMTSPIKTMMIPGIVLFMIFVFFLFRPRANEYFRPRTVPDEKKSSNAPQ